MTLVKGVMNHPPLAAAAPKEKAQSYISKAFWSGVVLLIVGAFWPELFTITSAQLWASRGTPGEWFTTALPVFLWGGGITFLIGIMTITRGGGVAKATEHLVAGTILSVVAGVFEEISFRWLLFLDAVILGVPITNWMSAGWRLPLLLGVGVGILVLASTKNGVATLFGTGVGVILGAAIFGWDYPGLVSTLHLNLFGPIADYFTAGYLHDYLFHPSGYAVGAGILSVNAMFRDGHKYNGPLGVLNAWFIGMFMFYLMFTYGLLSAILVHIVYDMCVFASGAIVLLFVPEDRRRRW